MQCVELFAGAGGLAMGVHLAGFKPRAVVEWDRWACDTIRENGALGFPLVAGWPIYESDVREVSWTDFDSEIDLVAGGPPCQPFSMGGKHQAFDDSRDMFPATLDVVRKLRPKAFIIENVKGLTRSAFANYYQYILLQLSFPEIIRKKSEDWYEHFRRLQTVKASGRAQELSYNVVPTLVNAADYGIPQKRERVFIVGFRSDLNVKWAFPKATHSFDALLHSQFVTGEYWDRHKVAKLDRPCISDILKVKLRKLKYIDLSSTSPWQTVRDALVGLPNPEIRHSNKFLNHKFQAGAKTYPGHTGSPLDLPAKTLKAGAHGVPGGENMLVRSDGTVRYFTVREAARIQTFPDCYRFHGSWTETMRQLGNAVPMMLGRIVASSVAERLIVAEMEKMREMISFKWSNVA